jgi:hypothetical protein
MRQKLCGNRTDISFAGKLWQVFRAVISGALDELRAVLGDAANLVMETFSAAFGQTRRKSGTIC